jgi:hypothetical protein
MKTNEELIKEACYIMNNQLHEMGIKERVKYYSNRLTEIKSILEIKKFKEVITYKNYKFYPKDDIK